MHTRFGAKQITLVAAAIASIFGFGLAQAGPIFTGPPTAEIMASDGVSTAVCFDNDPCDSNKNTGVINTELPLDGWFVNVDIGLTKEVIGSEISPRMDMAYQVAYLSALKAPGDGTLTLEFSDVGFLTPGAFTSQIGGTFGGAIASTAFADYAGPSNTLFDLSVPLCSQSFSTSPFSGGCGGTYGGGTPYSLTEQIVITGTQANGQASGDHALLFAPEPGTLLLLGGGLAGLGLFPRRRNNRA